MGSTSNNNDEISIESTDGPGGSNASTSMSKRKKCALGLFLSMGLLALVIGLSVGLGGKNGQRSTSSANSSTNAAALTLEACLADEEVAEADDDEAAEEMDVVTFSPTDSPTDSPVSDESVATRESNDVVVLDTGNRDLRGSIAIKRNASSKGKEPFDSSTQSRRLQCEDLMNANMSKSAKSSKVLKAPFCETVQKSCSSGTRLNGRGEVGGKAEKRNVLKGSEFMQPNTLDGCQDRPNGEPNDISVQRIAIKSTSETNAGKTRRLGEGRTARIVVDVQARANDYGESRGFVYSATDAYNPKWRFVNDFVVNKSGAQTKRIEYKIPTGTGEKGIQAVRVRFGFNIGKGRCGGGGDGNLYADVDDLAFAVNVPMARADTDAAFEDDYVYDELDDPEFIAEDSAEGADEEDADEDANIDDLN